MVLRRTIKLFYFLFLVVSYETVKVFYFLFLVVSYETVKVFYKISILHFIIHKKVVMSIGCTLNGSSKLDGFSILYPYTYTRIKIYKRDIKKRPEINPA